MLLPQSRFLLQRCSLHLSSCRTMSAPKSNLAKLRKKTGYSLSLCKEALEKNENDVGKADEWLKEQALDQGWAKANKLEGRNTKQGLIGILLRDNSASMIELNCETDFVARNQQFHELLNEISAINLGNAPSAEDNQLAMTHVSKDELAEMKDKKGRTLADLLALNIGVIGENLILRRAVALSAGGGLKLGAVTHPSGSFHKAEKVVQYGRYGSIVAYSKDENWGVMPEGQNTASMGRQFAQHVIGMNPTSIGDLSTFTQSKRNETDEGESENKAPKGADTEVDSEVERLDEKKEDAAELIHQDFLLNSESKVGDVLLQTGIDIKGFVRYEVGQDLD